jgi:hypothetical protein
MTREQSADRSPGQAAAGESLHAGITRWAGRADVTVLILLTVLGAVGTVVMVTVDWRRWPLAALLVSISAVGAWGLVEQKTAYPHSRLVVLLEWLLASIGGMAAAAGALGILFWLLGPAPIL